jgi:hypothetical protein
MNMQIIFLLSFLYRQRDISVRKYSHIDIKQNTKSLRSNNDCNIGRVCWMKCEMSRSRIFSCGVLVSISVHFFLYHRNDAENDYLVTDQIGKVRTEDKKKMNIRESLINVYFDSINCIYLDVVFFVYHILIEKYLIF